MTSEEMASAQIHTPEFSLEEVADTQIQVLLVQPITLMFYTLHVVSSSHPPSNVMRDIEGLANSVLIDLAVTFQMNLLGQVDLAAITSTL